MNISLYIELHECEKIISNSVDLIHKMYTILCIHCIVSADIYLILLIKYSRVVSELIIGTLVLPKAYGPNNIENLDCAANFSQRPYCYHPELIEFGPNR